LKLFIVTGASRGMGAALAEQLLADAGHTVLGIARRANAALVAVAARSGATLEQWQVDLAEPIAVAARLHAWLAARDGALFTQATLVNNAGVVTTIGPLEDCSVEELSSALRVGLEAPLLLTATFLRATTHWGGERRVLNISSGLGRRAMAGQATYCAAKAGMDNLSRAVALDQALVVNGAKIVSLAPGVIDTDMQVQLRSSSGRGFPEQQTFLKLKEAGQLVSSHDAAARLVAYLGRADFGANPVADVRDP
jgi:benzil reductase ((S)-benzoin forming)